MAKKGRAIYLVFTDLVDDRHDEEFNTWYDTRHLPQLTAIPGTDRGMAAVLQIGRIYARRYRVLEGEVRYTTVYEFENEAVPESLAWNHQREHSSPRSGAMRDAMTMAMGSPGVYRQVNFQQFT